MSEKTIEDGGPVFPCEVSGHSIRGTDELERFKVTGTFKGMTLRDHFAGLAMQALVAKDSVHGIDAPPWMVSKSYNIADAMIAARKGGEG